MENHTTLLARAVAILIAKMLGMKNLEIMTQAEFDLIIPDPGTIYFIKGA